MTSQPSRFPLAHRAAVALVLVALASAFSTGCSLLPSEQEEAAPPLVAPQQVEKDLLIVHKGNLLDQVTLRTIFAPARQERLYFRQGGLVKAVNVKAGDQVEADTVLVELESGELSFDLAAARISLQKTELALADSQRKAPMGRQVTDYEVQVRQLDLDLATVTLNRLQERLNQSRLVAPFRGLVVSVAKKVGEVAPNVETIVELADPTDLILTADVSSDADLAKLQAGQKVRLEFSELKGGGGEATLVQLPDPKAAGAQARQIRIRPDQADPAIKQGLTGKAHVILQEKKDVLLLANSAIRSFTGRTYVIVQTPQGKREVDVVAGIVGETETEIVKGLKEGDQVIGR